MQEEEKSEIRHKEEYLLKIVAGPHQGAEVALDEGDSLVVGSSSDCDLILSDTLVSDEHVKVIVSGGAVFIVPLASPTYLDGQEIVKDEQMRLDPFQFVSCGTTHFVVGPVGGDWPALSAADVPDLTKLEEGEVHEGGESEGKEEPEEAVVEEEEVGFKEDKTHVLMGAGGIVLFLILLMALVFVLFEPSIVEEDIDIRTQIGEKLDTLGFTQGFDIKEQKGIYIVEGWVDDNEDKDRISSGFFGFKGPVRLQIWSQEQILLAINDMLNEVKAPVTAESIEPGSVRLYGYFWNDEGWGKVKAEIAQEVKGIKHLDDEVYTPKELGPIVAEVLQQHGLVGKLQFVPAEDAVVVRGLISEGEIEKMRDVLSHFQSKVDNRVPLKNQILLAKAEDLYENLNMESVIIGDQGFIMTKDGRRVFEGGTLEGGYIVDKIDRDKIILRKGTQTITLNLGENYVR